MQWKQKLDSELSIQRKLQGLLETKRKMKTVSHETLVTEVVGAKGSRQRQRFDMEVEKQVELYNIGEAIKAARLMRGISQEQLGTLMGIKRSRVCQIEKGVGLTMSTISRSMQALQVKTNIVMEGVGTYSLA